MAEHAIDFKNVYKEFDGVEVLHDINLYIKQNEFMTLLGPSGCGKTTLLRIIGGFEEPTSGDIRLFGESIKGVPPYKRRVNTVFQSYALFPHLNVHENIAFGLKIKKLDRPAIEKRVNSMLKLVGLKGYGDRDISRLSGGQQQRVAIARALVNEPEVLLLDEPLGALDLKFRQEMQLELKRMQRSLGITFVYVTHDQEEALTMSDAITVMNSGVIQQIGTPEQIYNEPHNSFVADFIGESNIITGTMKADYLVNFSGHDFECLDRGFNENEPVRVVVRPEDIELSENIAEGMITGTVASTLFMGVHYETRLNGDDGFEWLVHSTEHYGIGSKVGFSLEPNDIHVMEVSYFDELRGMRTPLHFDRLGTNKPLAFPYFIWLVIFILAPLILIFVYAFTTAGSGGVTILTAENIINAFSPTYMSVFLRSVLYALAATLICLLLGYPVAYLLSRMKANTAAIVSMLFILPMWMNFLLRTYAWRALLDNNGIINQLLSSIGLEPVQFLYTGGAVLFGLVYNFLPFMILPIYSVFQKMDTSFVSAAYDLGANRWQAFWKVTLPLTRGGIISGVTMVFMPAMTTFVITRLLGGGQFMMYGDLIEMQFLQMSEWNFGSALAVVMMLLTILFMYVMRKYDKEGEGAGLM